MAYANSCEAVLRSEYLLGKILKRSRGSEAFVRASHVSSEWQRISKIETVVSGFASPNRMCFIGFVLEHSRPLDPEISLISPTVALEDDPAQALRESFLPDGLYGKHILGVYGGRVICRFKSGEHEGQLYTCRPYSGRPRYFKRAAAAITDMPKNPADSRYGQFAVVPPLTGSASGFPVFFVKDPSRGFNHDHLGVYFYIPGRVQVHVSVFTDGEWVAHAFDPMVAMKHPMFQRSPYSVQSGSRIYMMYLVNFIVWYDVAANTWGVVTLPGQLETTVKGCLEYIAGPHPEGELAIVHRDNQRLVRWVLTRTGDFVEWNEEAGVDLFGIFGASMTPSIFLALSVEPSEWRSVQVRAVSPDGRYVLISVAIDCGLFMVDMIAETVIVFPTVHKMGRVFPLSQYWPLKP